MPQSSKNLRLIHSAPSADSNGLHQNLGGGLKFSEAINNYVHRNNDNPHTNHKLDLQSLPDKKQIYW